MNNTSCYFREVTETCVKGIFEKNVVFEMAPAFQEGIFIRGRRLDVQAEKNQPNHVTHVD
jgi:hypothetical protein